MANKVLTKFESNNNTYAALHKIKLSGVTQTSHADTNGELDLSPVLPTVTTLNAGKVLTISSEGNSLEWAVAGAKDWDVNVSTNPEFIKHRPAIWRDTTSPAEAPDRNTGVILGDSMNTASGDCSVAEGSQATASGLASHAEGAQSTASGAASHAEGESTAASAANSHAEGSNTTASGSASHAEGNGTRALSAYSHAEGNQTTAGSNGPQKESAHAEGTSTVASAGSSHAEGYYTVASGIGAHAEGQYAEATAPGSHAEGLGTSTTHIVASGSASHAEGRSTVASGNYSHAEGQNTEATGIGSHAEGNGTNFLHNIASGNGSHAEGGTTTASGINSHAEGFNTIASGLYSHAEGQNTVAANTAQHVQGKWNVEDSESVYADIVGWGVGAARKNISALTTGGELHLAKEVYINSPNADASGGLKLVPALTQVGDVLKIKTMPTSTSAGELEWGAGGGGLTGTVGSTINPVYLNSGTITASDVHISRYSATEGTGKGEQVTLTYTPSTHSTVSHYVPTFNWLGHWDGRYGGTSATNASSLQFNDKGYMVGTGWSSRTVGSTDRPVYVNNGVATQVNTPASGAWFQGVPFVSSGGVMEVGRYIDLHPTTGSTADYTVRLDAGTNTAAKVFAFPAKAAGTYTLMTTADFNDTAYTASAYHSIYFAGADNTAGAITTIGMAAEATLSFNPSTKQFKYTTTDSTALNFGLTKVASW